MRRGGGELALGTNGPGAAAGHGFLGKLLDPILDHEVLALSGLVASWMEGSELTSNVSRVKLGARALERTVP
jgi:hypothetical protein